MAHYQRIGNVPPKRHTQHRTPQGGLYWVTSGFTTSSPKTHSEGLTW